MNDVGNIALSFFVTVSAIAYPANVTTSSNLANTSYYIYDGSSSGLHTHYKGVYTFNEKNKDGELKDYSDHTFELNINKLEMMSNLKEDWDACGGKPFSKDLINKVKQLLCNLTNYQPNIFPTSDSNIQLEFYNGDNDYLQFVITESGMEIYQTDGINYDNDTYSEEDYDERIVIDMIRDFYDDILQEAVVIYGQ